MFAALGGRVTCLRLLLEHGADVESGTGFGVMALEAAAFWNEVECIKLLLESGAKVKPGWRDEYPQHAVLWGDSTL